LPRPSTPTRTGRAECVKTDDIWGSQKFVSSDATAIWQTSLASG